MIRRILLVFWLIVVSFFSYSQFPGNIKLYQIKTQHYKLVFPRDLSNRAQSLAYFLEQTYPVNTRSLNAYPRRLTIVLNNQSTISNGYTALGPRHCFWYMTPYSRISLGITQWDRLLGIHEIRHNIQFQALDRNFNRILHFIDGQWGLAGGIGWSIPEWFLEGDAEFQETALSGSGRGRVGRFAMPVKAIAMEYSPKDLNYYKFFYRSYKTYYPNHYYLGYYLVSYVNRHWGPQIWANIIDHSTKYAFLPNAMNLSLKKYTSLNYSMLFDSTFTELKKIWEPAEIKATKHNEIFILPHQGKRTYTNYVNPFFINDSTVIAVKNGFDQIPTLVLINLNNGKEKKVRSLSTQDINYSNGVIVWSEINPHVRWTEASYSNIYLFDLRKNKIRRITRKGRFFSPALSPDAETIASVKLDYQLVPHIVLLNTKTKEIQKTFTFKQFEFIRFLRFWPNGGKIAFTATDKNGNGLYTLNIHTGEIKTLINPTTKFIIENPLVWKKYIVFTADISGTENVFALDTVTGEIYQITHRPYGAICSDIDQKTGELLIYNYTKNGFEPAIVYLRNNNWQHVTNYKQESYYLSSKTEPFVKDYTAIASNNGYEIKPYRRGLHLLYPHSWLWNIDINTDSTYTAGLTLYSNDVLKEMDLTLASTYYNTGQVVNNLKIIYRHFFPVLELNMRHTRNWNNDQANLYNEFNISLPLYFKRNVWQRKFMIKQKNILIYNFENRRFLGAEGLVFTGQNIRQRSYRDPETRLGQSLFVDYTHLWTTNNYQYTIIGTFNFPGILHHDIIKLSFYTQYLSNARIFQRQVSLPAGYHNITYNNIHRLKITYHVPLAYPDWGWRPVFNIKRIRAKAFYDIAQVDLQNIYRSTGLQMLFDFNLFGFNIDLSAGIQFAYRLEDNRFVLSPVIAYIPLNF